MYEKSNKNNEIDYKISVCIYGEVFVIGWSIFILKMDSIAFSTPWLRLHEKKTIVPTNRMNSIDPTRLCATPAQKLFFNPDNSACTRLEKSLSIDSICSDKISTIVSSRPRQFHPPSVSLVFTGFILSGCCSHSHLSAQ